MLIHTLTTDLRVIMLSEKSQFQKVTYCASPLMQPFQNNSINRHAKQINVCQRLGMGAGYRFDHKGGGGSMRELCGGMTWRKLGEGYTGFLCTVFPTSCDSLIILK